MKLEEIRLNCVQIGSRVLNVARLDSDYDFICDDNFYEEVRDSIINNHSIGGLSTFPEEFKTEVIKSKIESCEDLTFSEKYVEYSSDEFGPDLIMISRFTNEEGVYFNLFVYPNRKKFKLFKKIMKKMRAEINNNIKDIRVSNFIKWQNYYGTERDLS